MRKFVVTKERLNKAKKINSVLCHFLKETKLSNLKILDIGCGNGEIISYFDENSNEIYAVDALEQLNQNIQIKNYHLVESAELPFCNDFFDVIISNHVVEHIQDQSKHMQEIYRCLKGNGVCYYATPNKNFFIEPHHRVPFIHYLGDKFFHKILKIIGKYEEDLYLLSHKQMRNSFSENNFCKIEYTAKILKNPEKFYLETKLFRQFPQKILKSLQFLSPTSIFILIKKSN